MAEPIHYRYDTFSARIVALIIDSLVIVLPGVLLESVVDQAENFWLSSIFSVLTTLVVWSYFIIGHGFYGRTIGKKQQILRVVDSETEQPITMLQAMKRELLTIIPGLLSLSAAEFIETVPIGEDAAASLAIATMSIYSLIFVAEIAVCLNNPKRRALHDLIGGTVVVRENVPLI